MNVIKTSHGKSKLLRSIFTWLIAFIILVGASIIVCFCQNSKQVTLAWEIFLSIMVSSFMAVIVMQNCSKFESQSNSLDESNTTNPLAGLTIVKHIPQVENTSNVNNQCESCHKHTEEIAKAKHEKQNLKMQLESVNIQMENLKDDYDVLKTKLQTLTKQPSSRGSDIQLPVPPLIFQQIHARSDSSIARLHNSAKWKKGPPLGSGSSCSVFLSMDVTSGAFFACKQNNTDTSDKGELQSIQNEVELMSQFSHENIVQYLGSASSNIYFEEIVYPGSLRKVLDMFGSLEESVVTRYTVQLLNALAYLHQKKIVHRDVKGENILVDRLGRIRLCDFGAALRGGQSIRNGAHGTPYWMAPEVLVGKLGTASSDIWSVGCVVIEMVTSKPPYPHLHDEDNEMSLIYQLQASSSPEIPDKVTAECNDFLQQCLRRNPLERPSASKLIEHHWVGRARHIIIQKGKSVSNMGTLAVGSSTFISADMSELMGANRRLKNVSSSEHHWTSSREIMTPFSDSTVNLIEVCMSEETLILALRLLSFVRQPKPLSHYLDMAVTEIGSSSSGHRPQQNIEESARRSATLVNAKSDQSMRHLHSAMSLEEPPSAASSHPSAHPFGVQYP